MTTDPVTTPAAPAGRRNPHRAVAIACVAFVAGMVGAAYAAVPLYNMFCRLTGFDGTPLVASVAPETTLERRITVRFDTNVAPGLKLDFAPDERSVSVALGETRLVHFRATNRSDSPVVASATFNVLPETTGGYFNKMQCFCFEKMTFEPGKTVDLTVAFFLDPAMADDGELARIDTITLSYTYFPVKDVEKPVATKAGDATGKAKL